MSSVFETSHGKALSTAVLTLFMLNIVFWAAIRPTISTIIETKRKLSAYSNTLQALVNKNKQLDVLNQKYDELKPVLQKMSYYFPYNSDYSFLIDNLARTTQAFDFALPNVSFSEQINKRVSKRMENQYEYLSPVTYSFNIVGNQQNLQAFMAYWESMPFAPQFISVSYTPDSTDSENTFSLVFVAYKFKYKLIHD